MRIEERDFKIEHKGSSFVLYFLKTKKEIKELKEDEDDIDLAEDLYKIKGYYTVLFNAIQAALVWRMDKKYPFSESIPEFQKDYLKLKQSMNKLEEISQLIYFPIYELEKKMYHEHKQFLSRS